MLSLFEPLKVWRMKRSMTRAARRGEMVHLWWHPHNFGAHTEMNLASLETILKHFVKLKNDFKMESLSMSELAANL
jgi:hypothetical protein